MRILPAGIAYFALVFGTGFLLGIIRVPFLVPRLGVRTAELLEMPVMFVAILYAARYIVRRFALPQASRLPTGLIALALVAVAELTLAVLTPSRPRDPVSFSVYLALLGLFALMPTLVGPASRPVP